MTEPPSPKVSIIMPAYNSGAYIAESLDSALNQTHPHVEVIVVDDGSTDDTTAIVRSREGDIRLIRQQNAGSAAARNRGAEAASGEWLAFLDSDDVWNPHKLQRQLAKVGDRVWSHTDWYFVGAGADGTVLGSDRAPKFGGDVLAKLVVNNFIGTSTVLLRRDVFLEIGGFDESLRALQDWDLWLRIAARYEIDYLPEAVVSYRVHEASTSRSPRKTKPYHLQMIDRIYSEGGVGAGLKHLRRRTLAESYGILSIIAEESGDFPFSASCAFRSALYQPFSLYRWKSVLRNLLELARNAPL